MTTIYYLSWFCGFSWSFLLGDFMCLESDGSSGWSSEGLTGLQVQYNSFFHIFDASNGMARTDGSLSVCVSQHILSLWLAYTSSQHGSLRVVGLLTRWLGSS